MAIPIHVNQLGGGVVNRTFNFGGKALLRGHVLTAEEVRSIRPLNRSSLIDRGYLSVWPKGQHANPPEGSVRFVMPIGFGRGYHVVEGRRLNDEPLSKEEAYKLAGLPPPEPNGNGGRENAH